MFASGVDAFDIFFLIVFGPKISFICIGNRKGSKQLFLIIKLLGPYHHYWHVDGILATSLAAS